MHPIRKSLMIKTAMMTVIVGLTVCLLYKSLELFFGGSEWFGIIEENQLLILGFFGIFYFPPLIYLHIPFPDSHWEDTWGKRKH